MFDASGPQPDSILAPHCFLMQNMVIVLSVLICTDCLLISLRKVLMFCINSEVNMHPCFPYHPEDLHFEQYHMTSHPLSEASVTMVCDGVGWGGGEERENGNQSLCRCLLDFSSVSGRTELERTHKDTLLMMIVGKLDKLLPAAEVKSGMWCHKGDRGYMS